MFNIAASRSSGGVVLIVGLSRSLVFSLIGVAGRPAGPNDLSQAAVVDVP
jgi:hypothetical protein